MKKPFLVSTALFAASLALADDPPAKPESEPKETMKALMLEDAKRKAAEAAKTPTPAKPDKDAKLNPLAATEPPAAAPAPADKPSDKKTDVAKENAKAAAQPAAMLPKVEVTKARITVLDHELAEQNKDIAREQKLTKPTELDKALNGSKVSEKLSILGGESADYRANLAKERVGMMKDESDLIEAIAHAKTKEEKAELQKQLDELRAYRRDLEKSMR